MNTVAIEKPGSPLRAHAKLFEEAAATGALFRLYFVLFRMWAKNGGAIRQRRRFLEETGKTLPAEALRREYGHIAETRDMLLVLYEKRLPDRSLAPAYRIIARMLDDWDELAEDWAFASDPELGGLLDTLAAKL